MTLWRDLKYASYIPKYPQLLSSVSCPDYLPSTYPSLLHTCLVHWPKSPSFLNPPAECRKVTPQREDLTSFSRPVVAEPRYHRDQFDIMVTSGSVIAHREDTEDREIHWFLKRMTDSHYESNNGRDSSWWWSKCFVYLWGYHFALFDNTVGGN